MSLCSVQPAAIEGRMLRDTLQGGWPLWSVALAACHPSGSDGVRGGTPLPRDEEPATVPTDEGEEAVAVPSPVPLDCGSGRPGVGVDGVFVSEYLQAALDRAPAGATVELCGAAYLGPYTAPRPVHLVGLAGAAGTTLASTTGGTVVTLQPGSTMTGLSIRGGDAASGGGLRLTGPGSFTVDGCVVHGNVADLGGGVAIDGGATVTILRSTVTDNEAGTGGGVWVGAGSAVHLVETEIVGNRGRSFGGGAALDGGTLSGGQIADNEVLHATPFQRPPIDGGAGIYATGLSTITGSVVTGNGAANAPGILVRGGAVTITDTDVTGNGRSTDESASGGGVACDGADVTLYGTRITGNRAGEGGGIWARACTLSGGTVAGNESVGDGGGVVLFRSTLFQAAVSANVAGGYPSGVWLEGSADLVDCVVEGHGGARGAVEAGPESRIVGTSITDNTTCGVLVSGQVTLDDAAVLRNDTGACLLGGFDPTARLESVGSDWGIGDDDNAVDLSWGGAYTGYGPDATFSCTDVCTPTP